MDNKQHKQNEARQRLTDIVVREVSLVDRPANQQPFLVIKRTGDNKMEAPLNSAIPEEGVDLAVEKTSTPKEKDMKIVQNLGEAISALMAKLPEEMMNAPEAQAVADQLGRVEDYVASMIEQLGGEPPQTASEAQAEGEMNPEDKMSDEEKMKDPSQMKSEDPEGEEETAPPEPVDPSTEKTEEAPSVDLKELRDLLASLHGELGKQTQKTEEVSKRLETLESARLPSRSTGEIINKSASTSDVFSGLIFNK